MTVQYTGINNSNKCSRVIIWSFKFYFGLSYSKIFIKIYHPGNVLWHNDRVGTEEYYLCIVIDAEKILNGLTMTRF